MENKQQKNCLKVRERERRKERTKFLLFLVEKDRNDRKILTKKGKK